MKVLKGKVFLFLCVGSLALLGGSLRVVAQQQDSASPLNAATQSNMTPQFQLTNCDLVPPNGYVWVGTINKASCGSVGHAMVAYVFESYFDKPVGTTLQLCSPNFVPQGWYIINEVANFNCSAPSGKKARQWIIQRFN